MFTRRLMWFGFVMLLLCVLLLPASTALAQDTGGVPPPSGDPWVDAIWAVLKEMAVATPFAATLILLFTALLKRFIQIDANVIAGILQVLFWVAWIFAARAGYGQQLEAWVGTATTILQALGAVLGFSVSAYVTAKAYALSAKEGVPVLGWTRTAANSPV